MKRRERIAEILERSIRDGILVENFSDLVDQLAEDTAQDTVNTLARELTDVIEGKPKRDPFTVNDELKAALVEIGV